MKKRIKHYSNDSFFKHLEKDLIWKRKEKTRKRLLNEIFLLENRSKSEK